jgi:Ca2+ transporting ATPase
MSIFFQAFVLMQVFNSVTCRKLDDASLNPFSKLFSNPIFWFIQSLTLVVQYLFLMFGGVFVGVVDLTLT